MTGRTVFGHSPAKGQQLDDHYFGSIPARVHGFMLEFEEEANLLGIPLRTRHNEVAPNHSSAPPRFEGRQLGRRSQPVVDGRDGSGGRAPQLQGAAARKALCRRQRQRQAQQLGDEYRHRREPARARSPPQGEPAVLGVLHYHHSGRAPLRRLAARQHRLGFERPPPGANEAPPAIVSVFVGSMLDSVLDELERTAKLPLDKGDNIYLKLGIDKIPAILLDNTDRNRTSPFAFTGNKFELRAVGSSANCSSAMTVLNTIVGNQLIEFKQSVDALIDQGKKKEVAIVEVLREYVISSKNIRFEGNGYSEEWKAEAERRGLSNIATTPQALDALVREDAAELFARHGIFSEVELHARHEILLEEYQKKIQIESRVLGDLAINHIIPTALSYQTKLVNNVRGLRELGLDDEHSQVTVEMIKSISRYVSTIKTNADAMTEARKQANKIEDARALAVAYCEEVKPKFEPIRRAVDKLEQMVSDEDWPLVKYRELLFSR
jgi:glutamine synthetase